MAILIGKKSGKKIPCWPFLASEVSVVEDQIKNFLFFNQGLANKTAQLFPLRLI